MRTVKFPKFTTVLVEWVDITSDSKWNSITDVAKAKPTTVKTIGFFVNNKKRNLILSHSITEDGDSDYTVIPWGCIVKIKEVQ